MIKPNRFAVAITGLLLSATIASAQGTLTEADIKRAIRRSENEDELADLIDEVMTIGKPGETGR